MNKIQMISREIEAQRLKLQMGLDPNVEMDADAVRDMWRQLNLERIKARILLHQATRVSPESQAA